jgi:protoheme IX farnesyltransferase
MQNAVVQKNDISDAIGSYFQLTKPTIMLLVVLSGAVALFIEGSLLIEPLRCCAILLAVYLTGGCANALNQYFERDIDAKMTRTQKRRPLPQGKIQPTNALIFIVAIGAIGVLIFGLMFNWLSAMLSLGTILFYGFFYTLWLKPNTPQNIVIGGAAGAMAPIGVWAGVTGEIALEPMLVFLIVFLWTPPHFWALALYCKDDYIKAELPMMPVVKGERETVKQMFTYSLLTVLASLWLAVIHDGWIYDVAAVLLGAMFIKRNWEILQSYSEQSARKLFFFSIAYLFGLFAALILDRVLKMVIERT